jgi:hypothetical protein
LETLPGAAGAISGNDTVCSNNETYTYTVPVISGATSYQWSVPPGITITSGSGTNSVVLTVSGAAVSGPVTVKGNNTCGAGTASSKNIIVKVCAGIPQHSAEPGISVYPNPAEGILNIAIIGGVKEMELQIVDVRGQVIYRESLENKPADFTHAIDVSQFSRGVYFVELVNSKRFVIKKVVLQ